MNPASPAASAGSPVWRSTKPSTALHERHTRQAAVFKMNALRALGFTTSSRFRLLPAAGWPRLPATLILDRVVGVGVDSRGVIYVAHRGEQPLFCLNPDGTFRREV